MKIVECIDCGCDFRAKKKSPTKRCKRCRTKRRKEQVARAHENEILRNGGLPGVGRGGNQEGETNHMWRGGRRTYRKRAVNLHGEQCKMCNSRRNVVVHHIDGNRNNNRINNLIPLCAECHGYIHECYKN